VLKTLLQQLPQYDYVYLGDNARAPYGDRSQEVIYGYAEQAIQALQEQGCKLIIFACNTTSAEALPQLIEKHGKEVPMLGVIEPLVLQALASGAKRLGVLATRSTVTSGRYPAVARQINSKVRVIQVAAPLLVPMIEEGVERKPWTRRIIKQYVHQLTQQNVDALLLGCTHYGLIDDIIKQYAGRQVTVLEASAPLATELAQLLERDQDLAKKLTTGASRRYYTTDDPERFSQAAMKFLGQRIKVTKIKLT